MYKEDYCKKSYFKEYEKFELEDSSYDECIDDPDEYMSYYPVGPVLDNYTNHLVAVLVVGCLFMVAVAVFGLLPVLGTLMITAMYSLLLGMFLCLAFMGNF